MGPIFALLLEANCKVEEAGTVMSSFPSNHPVGRTAPRVHHINSPLTRIGLTLASGSAQLLVVAAGQISFRTANGEANPPIDAPRLVWLKDGGRELLAEGGARATVVSIPELALANALPSTLLGEQMRRTLGQDLSLSHPSPEKILALVEGFESERTNTEPGSEEAATHYISLLLLQLWRIARSDLVAHGRAPQGLAERFISLAGQHARQHLKILDYANALGVSRDRLGSAVRRATGHSPQSYLHHLLIREASQLLTSTGMPIGEVAFRLGFSDPAYFTRFFIRHCAKSPVRFRTAARELRAHGDTSYSAWP